MVVIVGGKGGGGGMVVFLQLLLKRIAGIHWHNFQLTTTKPPTATYHMIEMTELYIYEYHGPKSANGDVADVALSLTGLSSWPY